MERWSKTKQHKFLTKSELLAIFVIVVFSSSVVFCYISLLFVNILAESSKSDVLVNIKNRNNLYSPERRTKEKIKEDYVELGIALLSKLTSRLITNKQSDFEKAIVLMNFTHFYLNRSKTPYNASQGVFFVLTIGNGQCPQYSCVSACACQVYGLEARRMGLTLDGYTSNAHTITEVRIDNKWKIFDPLFNIFLNYSILEFHEFNVSLREEILNKTYDSMQLKQAETRKGIMSLARYYDAFFKYIEDPSVFDSFHCSYTPIYNDGELQNVPINLDLSWYGGE